MPIQYRPSHTWENVTGKDETAVLGDETAVIGDETEDAAVLLSEFGPPLDIILDTEPAEATVVRKIEAVGKIGEIT